MMKDLFWNIRADKYDKLFWTKDASYIDAILKVGQFNKNDIVLDVGTGTGIMARKVKPMVKHIIALDNSTAMLNMGKWEGFSFVKWDIAERIFKDNIFDKVIARMVFHHIFDDLGKVCVRCFDVLKNPGMLIVAEGVPPSDDKEIVEWYTEMFKHKEERRIFSSDKLAKYLVRAGFRDIECHTHIMENFSVCNWVENSGLDEESKKYILDMHRNASPKVKKAYNMSIVGNDCLINTKNIIMTGKKYI